MGGLRKDLPVAFWTFLIAGCSLAGLPFITAGFFSKDLIIWGALSAGQGHPGFWIAGIIGALLTSLYTFRLIFRVFFGPLGTPVTKRPGYAMTIPLLILAFLSIVGGYLKQPSLDFLHLVLPSTIEAPTGALTEIHSEAIAAIVFLIGVYFRLSVPSSEAKPGARHGRESRGTRAAPMVVFGLGLRRAI